jgi:lysophospholipase L1-like esterase
MSDRNHPRSKKVWFAACAAVFAVALALIGGEILTRLFWHDRPGPDDERTLSYRYDSELGWFPAPNSTNQFMGSRLVTIRHNNDGFRDVPHGPKQKKRIAFLGDSFVWGYDAEQEERFTEKLQAQLADWEVLNMGISGYSTDQELLLLEKWFDRYQPDIVVLVYCDNDVEENRLNIVYGGYHKPYFEQVGARLIKRGVPVPKSFYYYRAEYPLLFKSQLVQIVCALYVARKAPKHVSEANPTLGLVVAMKAYVESKGAKFMIGFVTDLQEARKRSFCAAGRIDYLFLLDPSFPTWDYLYRTQGHHWTPAGHDRVCARLYEFMTANHFFQNGQQPGTNSPGRN